VRHNADVSGILLSKLMFAAKSGFFLVLVFGFGQTDTKTNSQNLYYDALFASAIQ